MKPLAAPDNQSAFRYYELIVAAKRNIGDLSHMGGRVEGAYASYWEHRTNLERLSPLPGLLDAERKSLKDCYSSKSRAVQPLRELMGIIKARQTRNARAVCQHCGIDTPETFDHYLPKTVFHEFSVCALNLVPCCYVCNVTRDGQPWCRDGERSSLHLYFDDIEVDEPCLEAEVTEHEGGFRVLYSYVETSKNPFAGRYRRHCETLGLLERWGGRATGKLDDIRAELEPWREQGLETIVRVLSQVAVAKAHALGANNWEVALYHAVSRAHDFIVDVLGEEQHHG